MSYRFVKRQNTIGWDWYLESGDCSSWVSQPTKEIIESLESENDKLRELLIDAYKDMDAWQMVIANSDQWGYGKGCLERLYKLREAMRELGVEL